MTISSTLYSQEIKSRKLFFETDSINLSINEQTKIQNFIDSLNLAKITSISVSGFCDDVGSKNYNYILSVKRAKNIALIFQNLNLNNKVVFNIEGMGEVSLDSKNQKPISQQRIQNRYSKIVIETLKKETNKAINKSIAKDFKKSSIGDNVILENILFKPGTQYLLDSSYAALNTLFKSLECNKDLVILIQGHIFNPGNIENDGFNPETGEYNLSESRARTIFDYLIKNGTDANRLSYEGLGGNYPTGKGAKHDRRVEIIILNK